MRKREEKSLIQRGILGILAAKSEQWQIPQGGLTRGRFQWITIEDSRSKLKNYRAR